MKITDDIINLHKKLENNYHIILDINDLSQGWYESVKDWILCSVAVYQDDLSDNQIKEIYNIVERYECKGGGLKK